MADANFQVKKGLTVPKGSESEPSIIFTAADSDTGIYSPAENQVSVATAGSEVVRVNSSGQIQAVGSGSAAVPIYTFAEDNDTGIFSPGNNELAIASSGIQRVKFGTSEVVFNDDGENVDLRIEGNSEANLVFVDASTDRVGLGTSSPVYTLDVQAATANASLGSTTGTNVSFLNFNNTGGNAYVGLENSTGGNFSTGTGAYSLCLAHSGAYPICFATNNTEHARIDSSGRLLVDTASTTNRGVAKHIVEGDMSFGNGTGKAHTIYKETTNLADAGTFDVDLISGTGACCGFGTVFYREGTNQQVQTFSFAGRQTGAVVQLQDANVRNSGVSGVTVTFAAVSSAGKIRITNGSGSTLDAVQVTLFLHSTLN